MCEPVSLTMAAVSAGAAVTQIMGAQQAQATGEAEETARKIAQDGLIEENKRRSTEDYLTKVKLEQRAQMEEHEAVAMKGFDIKQQMIKSVGTATASAAERGVEGSTVDSIVSDFEFQANAEAGRIYQSQRNTDAQHTQNLEAARLERHYNNESMQPYIKKQQKPVDYFGPIFGAAAQTLGTGAQVGAFRPSGGLTSKLTSTGTGLTQSDYTRHSLAAIK